MTCAIANRSCDGAHLEVATTRNVPDAFLLQIEAEPELVLATVIWRRKRKLGVRFARALSTRH